MNLRQTLADIAGEIDKQAAEIEAAADAKDPGASPGPFGIAIATKDGDVITAGATDRFPIQSIAKVFALDLALQAFEDRVSKRVGREPSGDPFNSLVDLERNDGVPRNPFINAGALVAGRKVAPTNLANRCCLSLVGAEGGDLVVDGNQHIGHGFRSRLHSLRGCVDEAKLLQASKELVTRLLAKHLPAAVGRAVKLGTEGRQIALSFDRFHQLVEVLRRRLQMGQPEQRQYGTVLVALRGPDEPRQLLLPECGPAVVPMLNRRRALLGPGRSASLPCKRLRRSVRQSDLHRCLLSRWA